jgi:hypothetical protein
MLICLFGAPNGLCSSITESKHIKVVKVPWCQSNQYNALLQMVLTNQQPDKLAAACTSFQNWGMLNEGSILLAATILKFATENKKFKNNNTKRNISPNLYLRISSHPG